MADNRYARHKTRLKFAHTVIDNLPPVVHLNKQNTIRIEKSSGNASGSKKVYIHNTQLLMNIERIRHRVVATDKYRPCKSNQINCSGLSSVHGAIEKIENFNRLFGNRLLKISPALNTNRQVGNRNELWEKYFNNFVVPDEILGKYKDLVLLPKDVSELYRLLRPIIFFDLSIRDRCPLGRIIIQLYTEACPQVVLEFVRACQSPNTERLQVHRLFPNLWLEGELSVQNNKLITSEIEYDMRAIDHGKSSGVLSFSRRHLKGFTHGIVDFAISFKPLNVLNGHRVGFGRVVKGMRLLNSLKTNGTKNGGPMEDYYVHSWGTL